MADNDDRELLKIRESFLDTKLDAKKGDGFYDSYSNFSKSLRGWLVAYGIGAPVLFASQPAFARVLSDTGRAVPIIWMFLAGLLIQVALVMFYKYAMWVFYRGETLAGHKSQRIYRYCDFFCEWTIIEFLLDLASVILFVFATVALLRSYVDTSLSAQQAAQHASQIAQQAAGAAQQAAQSAQQAVQKIQASPPAVLPAKPSTRSP